MTQSASESETHNLVLSEQTRGYDVAPLYRLSCDCGWQYLTAGQPVFDEKLQRWYQTVLSMGSVFIIECPYA